MPRTITTIVILAILVCTLVLGCGKRQKSPQTEGETSKNLTLSTLSSMDGDQLKVSVFWSGAEDLYQLSCRVSFDPAGWRPVSVKDGGAFGDDVLFFASTDQSGFVPIAVTPLLKGPGVKGDGTLAVVSFKQLTPGYPQPELLDDPAYLKARNSAEQAVDLVLGGAR